MKKNILFLSLILFIIGIAHAENISKEQVKNLVNKTSNDVKNDAPGTFKSIIAGKHPYKNKDSAAFYVFVYDLDIKIVAHPKKTLIGRSYRGKPDVRGKKFRDEIVNGAIRQKTGWVDYSYQKPGETGIHKKTTYFKLTTGSDGKKYVICSGKYKD